MGGGLTHIIDNNTGRELLYQINPSIWSSQDIVIFPIIDRPMFTVNGKSYICDMKHGVLRQEQAIILSKEERSLTLRFVSNASTLRQYPFEFVFDVLCMLTGNSIEVVYTVTNNRKKLMPCYVGGHPGLYAKNGIAELVFPTKENLEIWMLEDDEVVSHKPFGLVDSLLISKETLDKYKTFILTGMKTNEYLMKTTDVDYLIKTNAPVIGLWSKLSGGDYVCFEPWWGMARKKEECLELIKKDYVNIIQDKASFGYSITPIMHEDRLISTICQ